MGKPFDGIILPGGESTVQGKLLKELDMFDTLKNMIKNEVPVLATCAGLILLAEKLEMTVIHILAHYPFQLSVTPTEDSLAVSLQRKISKVSERFQ